MQPQCVFPEVLVKGFILHDQQVQILGHREEKSEATGPIPASCSTGQGQGLHVLGSQRAQIAQIGSSFWVPRERSLTPSKGPPPELMACFSAFSSDTHLDDAAGPLFLLQQPLVGVQEMQEHGKAGLLPS